MGEEGEKAEKGKDWPICYKEQLILGNPKSNVGICTLWTAKENFLDLPEEKYSLVGNLYSSYGINPMLKNILANPRIRHIIVCGEDLNKTRKILTNFSEKGFDENYKIVESEAYIDKAIPKEALEKVRKNLNLIGVGKKNVEEVKSEIRTILDRISREEENFMTPTVIMEESSAETLYSEEEAFRVEGNAVPETWLKALDLIMKFGEEKSSEYGIRQKEILDLITVIKHDETGNGEDEDDKDKVPAWFPFSRKEMEDYLQKFFSAEKPEGVSYTYGERLTGQVEAAVQRLKKNLHTRRAIAVTWKQEEDKASNNPPCLIEVLWSVKNGRLCQTSTFRSHDMFGAWPLNIFALKQLQKRIAAEVGIIPGNLINVSVSAHIYENNWKMAERLVEENYRGRGMLLEEDPRGFFVIRIESEKGEIVVEHRLKDGRKTRYGFRGKRAEEIYRKILNENLVSMLDHAAYLGKELARAEAALKENKPYVQERA